MKQKLEQKLHTSTLCQVSMQEKKNNKQNKGKLVNQIGQFLKLINEESSSILKKEAKVDRF